MISRNNYVGHKYRTTPMTKIILMSLQLFNTNFNTPVELVSYKLFK